MEFNLLQKKDFHKGFLQLLEQLTEVNADSIDFDSFSDYYDEICDDNNLVFVLRNDKNDKILATGKLIIECKFIHELSKIGHIEDVVVDKSQMGKKIGKHLIEFLLNKAKEFGCYKTILNCAEKNKGFYEKCGMTSKNIEMSKYY